MNIDAIFWYMKRIFRWELISTAFSMTWLIAIWKRRSSALDLNMIMFIHFREWET